MPPHLHCVPFLSVKVKSPSSASSSAAIVDLPTAQIAKSTCTRTGTRSPTLAVSEAVPRVTPIPAHFESICAFTPSVPLLPFHLPSILSPPILPPQHPNNNSSRPVLSCTGTMHLIPLNVSFHSTPQPGPILSVMQSVAGFKWKEESVMRITTFRIPRTILHRPWLEIREWTLKSTPTKSMVV